MGKHKEIFRRKSHALRSTPKMTRGLCVLAGGPGRRGQHRTWGTSSWFHGRAGLRIPQQQLLVSRLILSSEKAVFIPFSLNI